MVCSREITKMRSIVPPRFIGSPPVVTGELRVAAGLGARGRRRRSVASSRAVVVPVDPSTEVETEPLIGVVVNNGASRPARSGNGDVDDTRRLRPTFCVPATL